MCRHIEYSVIIFLLMLANFTHAEIILNVYGNSSGNTTITTNAPNPWEYDVNLGNLQIYFKEKIKSAKAIQFQIQNSEGTRSVSYQLQGAGNEKGVVSDNSITYPDVFDYTNITYTVTPHHLVKTLVLFNESAPINFTFKLQSEDVNYGVSSDNSVIFYDETTGERLWVVKAPFAYDSAVEPQAVNVYQVLRSAGPNIFLDLIINETELSAFTYPIYIDPTTGSCGPLVNSTDIYVLNGTIVDAPGTCMLVDAHNVTLDCAGFSIGGTGTASSNGISANGYENVSIRNCVLHNFSTGLSYSLGLGANITNNTIYNNSEYGISIVDSSNNYLFLNTVFSNSGAGIHVSGSSSDNSLFSNAIYDHVQGRATGIFLQDVNTINYVYDNPVIENNTYGIYINRSNLTQVTNNTMHLNSDSGIYIVSGSMHNFTANIASNNTYGFYANNANNNNLTSNNASYNSGGDAFSLSQSSNNVLFDNIGYSNNRGFNVAGDNNNVSSNNACNNSQHGLLISGSDNNIFSNTFCNNSETGIYLTGSSSNNQIFSNIIYNHTSDLASGIFFQGINTINYIYDNQIIENNTYGIYLNHSNLTQVTNNTLHLNSNSAIYITSSSYNNVSSNSVYNNEYGFFFVASQDNNLSLNNASNNSQSQYLFNDSNSTFTNVNYALNVPSGATLIDATDRSVVTALVGSTYHDLVTDALNFSFSNATNVSFHNATTNFSAVNVGMTACASTKMTCHTYSDLLVINNLSGTATINQLILYYHSDRFSDDHYTITDLQFARYNRSSGWTGLGPSVIDFRLVRHGPINLFGPFAIVAFETVGTSPSPSTTSGESSKPPTEETPPEEAPSGEVPSEEPVEETTPTPSEISSEEAAGEASEEALLAEEQPHPLKEELPEQSSLHRIPGSASTPQPPLETSEGTPVTATEESNFGLILGVIVILVLLFAAVWHFFKK